MQPVGRADSESGRATGVSWTAEPGAGAAASQSAQRAADLTTSYHR
jgi:hypothetical protein